MYIPHFAYPFICWWILGLFPSFSYVNNTVNMGVQIPPFPAFTSFGYIVIPWYQQGIGSKTCHRYQNPRMFNSHSWPFVSTVPHLWIQPTANLVVLYIFIKKRKKSVYKWTRAVQTWVAQGSTVYMLSWAKEEWRRVCGIKEGKDISQDNKKNRCLVIRCLPCHTHRSLSKIYFC